ncbi:MAG: zinc-binding alcohol dehydrogenase [Oscillospiraceae bacterium]
MKSSYIVLTAKGCAECAQEDICAENLAQNEAIIETEATMISAGTELSRVFAIKEGFSYPVRPGYSAVGRVLKKGEGLCDIEVGDKVFYSGPHASVNRFSRGNKTQGPMIFKIPQDMDAKSATIITLGLVAMNGVNAADVKLGDTLAVFGLGAIGIIAAILFAKLGARVIAIDPVKSRCDLAKSLGIKETLCCNGGEEQVAALKSMTDGRGVDIAVDVTGVSAAIESAALACGPHAQLILLGSPRAPYTSNLTTLLSAIHMKMIRVIGAFNNLNPVFETEGSRLCVERNFKVVCGLIEQNVIDANKIISQVISPAEVQSAYHGLMYDKENYRCVVIDWTSLKEK